MNRFSFSIVVLIFSVVAAQKSSARIPAQDYLERIEHLKLLLEDITDPSERVTTMCEIADLYYTVNPDSGLVYGQGALSLAYANDDTRGKINAHDRLGFLYQTLGKFEEASEHLTTALQLSEVSPDSIKTIDILNHLGAMNHNQNTEQALKFYLRALQLSQSLNDNRRIASSYNHIGTIYYQQKNFQKALEHNIKSLNAWNQIDSMLTAGVSSDIGNIYYRLLDYEHALAYYHRAYRIAERNSDFLALGYTLANIGMVVMDQGRMDEAISRFRESLKYRTLLDNKEGISNSLSLIAQWHFRRQQFDSAYAYAKRNFDIARQIGLKRSINDAYGIIVDIHAAQRQYAKALQYHAEWMRYKDSVAENENSAFLARMEVLYDTERKEAENKLLKAQQSNTEAVLERQIVITLSVAILLLFSGIGIVALYRSNRSKREINSELRRQHQVIEQQNLQLKNLHGIKDKLFSILTHDLRGPISSLKMFITYLREEELDQKAIKDYTAQSSSTIDHMMNTMENVLQWSKSQWKGLTVEPTLINIYQIAKEKIRLVDDMAKEKSVVVHNLIPPSAEAYADEQMINIVFRNLLTNAVKFTEAGGSIRIRCAEYDDVVEVSVEDSGIGMSPEQLRTAFTFDHTPLTGTNDEKGVGLGLLLCKEFVEKNGGVIRVESVLGAGSVFTFSIPRSKSIAERRTSATRQE